MATQYSNKPIVTDGLVYALDFGNIRSYVSGSSTAKSLLFRTTTASISSSGLDNQGFINLGSSNYVDTNTSGYNLGYTSGYTMIFTAEPKGNLNNYEAGQIVQGGDENTQRFWTGLSSTRISHWFLPNTSVSSVQAYIGRRFPITPGKQHIAIRYSSGSYSLFRNGILQPPSDASGFGLAAGGTLSIGATSYFGITGSFAQFQVYNRPLTSDEIWSNYQLTAQRYGLGPQSPKPYSLDENAFLFLSQSGITDPIITSSINTFVLGLKSSSLWDKMIAIYPFVGTGSIGVNLTGSQRWNLKEPTTAFYYNSYNGAWQGSVSGSTPSGSNTYINTGVTPRSYHPNFLNNNAHISILSYDTPTSSSMLAGTGMTREVAVSTLAGDYGTPAAAYSVRKVRTAYSGALMDVRRSIDNVTQSIGYVSNGDLDTGSLLNFANAVGENSPGNYSGLAAAYSLRRVSASYSGNAIDVRRSDNVTSSIGFDASGNLNTGSLLSFAYTENKLLYSNTLNNAAWTNNFGRITITTASAIAPDGTNTGTLLSGSYQASPNSLALAQVAIGSTSLRYTSVLYVSQSTSDYVYLRPGDNTACVYRFSTGVFTNVGPRVATLTSESAANGWIKLTATTPANENYVNYYIGPTDNTSSLNYGNPISPGAVYVWGAQLNSGSTALPYIQTTTAATTSSYVTTYVTQWYDQSGNNRHATQSVSTQQPVIISSGSLVTLKGKPSIYFDSVDDAMLTPTLLNKPYAVILVAQQEVGSYIQRIINSPTRNSLIAITRVQETVAAAGDISSGSIGLVNTPYVVSLVNDTTSSQVYSNTVNKTTTFNNNDFGLMNFGASGVYNEPAQAFVSEVIAYTGSSQISSSRSLIENNINNYYSIYTSSNAGYVARWYDQSGNNRHATQTATGSQPVIVLSGSIVTTNSKPSLNFDNNKSLSNSTTTFNQPNTFYVVESASAAISRVSIYSTDLSTRNQTYQDPQFRLFAGTDLIGSSTAYGHRLVTSVFNTANSTGFQNGILRAAGNVGTQNQQGITIGDSTYGNGSGTYQEVIHYNSNQSTNREAVEYGINNYYNIYPQTSSFTTSSFAIYATSGSVSASLNNDLVSGISSTGPLGFITVSRTGSNSLTIARNGVTSSFTVPASGALSTGIYLGAINNNGLALANSPLGISFASVGTGLSNTEVRTLNNLTTKLQLDLQRVSVLDQYPGARSAYSVRKLSKNYTGSAIQVIRSSDNAIADIGFNGFDLDTTTLLNFVGTGTSNHGYVRTWYDQSGFNNHVTQSSHSTSTHVAIVLSGSLVTQGTKPALYMNGQNMIGTVFTASEMSTYFVGNIYGNCYNGYFYNRTTTGYSFTILNDACNTQWRSTLVRYSASIDTSWPESLHGSTYRFPAGFTGRLIETWNFSGSRSTSDYALNGANTSITDPITGYAGASGFCRVGPTGYTGNAGGQVYFQEFIIYDRKQTSAIAIQDNLDQYFEVY